jgi:tRNA(adenine34) deaminase
MADHTTWMKEALTEAKKALAKDEVPVGAVVVYDDKIIGRGHNLMETLQDPTAHAEMLAIQSAANFLASWRLEDTTLYVTLEPCSMCAGAILMSRIPNVVYGASDPRYGACGSAIQVANSENLDIQTNLTCGILENECSQLLKDFFVELRQKKKN